MFYLLRFCAHFFCAAVSDDRSPTFVLETSLYAKEKIISDLNMELHRMETTLSDEREKHLNEIKKLNALLDEKVFATFLSLVILFLKSVYFI